MWLLAASLGITGMPARVMILMGALPTASITSMFAVEYGTYIDESDATIVLSTILSTITISGVIALTR
jgi:predicted permease